MSKSGGLHFKMMAIQAGPVPPSGGPARVAYLDRLGRQELNIASAEYSQAVEFLGASISSMPIIDFPLVEIDDEIREQICEDKRSQWNEFVKGIDKMTLDIARPHIQRSVQASVNALNYLEDHELKEEAHGAIHRSSFVRRGLYGCPVTLRDDRYWTDCPINISHLRLGVSVGMTGDIECSICGKLIEDCEHQNGEHYFVTAKHSEAGECTICGLLDCEHHEGEEFPVQAIEIGRSMQVQEVCLVARPRYPLARIVEVQKDLGTMGNLPSIERAARIGSLNCDVDLGPCRGFNDVRNWQNL